MRRGLGDPAAAREFLAVRRAARAARGRCPASPRRPTAWRARSAGASRSPCTATTTATASARRRSWCGPCAARGARRRGLPAEPLHRGLRRRRGDGRAPAGRAGRARAGLRRLRHVGGRGADPRRRPRDGRRSCSTTTWRAGAGRRAILANPALGRPDDDLPGRRRRGPHGSCGRWPAALDGGGLAPDPDEGIDLVALATVADAVPLIGDNRRRVAQGLRAMRERPRPGIAALCAAAGIEPRARHRPHARVHPGARASTRPAGWPTPSRGLDLLLAPDRETADPIARRAVGAQRRAPGGRAGDPRGGRRPDRGRARRDPRARGDRGRPGTAGTRASSGIVAVAAGRALRAPGDRALAPGRRGQGLGPEPAGRRPARARGGGVGDARRAGAATPARWAWSCRPPTIARFRDDLMLAAEGARAAIARARVREVDAVVGGRDLTLATAEAIEALAPFGRGNPPVRLVRARAPSWSRRRGWGRASTCRCGCAPAASTPARSASAWASGPAGIALDERHDALVSLEIERWQGLVGPRVAVEALEELPVRATSCPGQCAQACDVRCPDRRRRRDLRALLGRPATDRPRRAAAARRGPPLGVRDRRGRGRLAGGARGPRRAPTAAWSPWWPTSPGAAGRWRRRSSRAGWALEVAVLAGGRCDPGAMARPPRPRPRRPGAADARLRAPGRGRAAGGHAPRAGRSARRPRATRPGPRHRAGGPLAAPGLGRAARPTLALAGGRGGVGAAPGRHGPLDRAARRRPGARGGPTSRRVLLGDGPTARPPRVAARALRVLAEVGLVEVGEDGVRAAPDPARRDLDESALYRACRERLDEARALLARAQTLDLLARPSSPRGPCRAERRRAAGARVPAGWSRGSAQAGRQRYVITYGEGPRRPGSGPRAGRPGARRPHRGGRRAPSGRRPRRDPARLRVRRGAPPHPAARLAASRSSRTPSGARASAPGSGWTAPAVVAGAAARHRRGHRRHARGHRARASAPRSRRWWTGSPSSRRSTSTARRSTRPRTTAS